MNSREIKAELKRRGYKTILVTGTHTKQNWITARFKPNWQKSGKLGPLVYDEPGFSDDFMRAALVVVYGPDFVKDGRISGGNISRYSIALTESQWPELFSRCTA